MLRRYSAPVPYRFHLIAPSDLAFPWPLALAPLAIVQLTSASAKFAPAAPQLPPCPLIGIGSVDHPLAAHCDMRLDQAEDAAPLIAAIKAHPHAAAVLVQLLRHIDGMAVEPALVAESLAYGLLQGGSEHGDWLARQVPAPAQPGGAVELNRRDDRLSIRLNRPHAHNAIDRDLRDALREAFELAALDDSITAVSLSGAGRAFCVGADLSEFGTTRDPALAHAIRMATLPAHAIARCADRLHVHIHGACVGSGLEMAAFAAHITASRNAWFHLPELAMGLIPGAGGCVSLSRRIGRQRAAQLILSGRRINVATALDWGLVDTLVDD